MTGDRILLSGLRVRGHHGVLAHEAQLGQVFVVDLELVVDLAGAGRSDDLGMTVDYGSLAGRVAEVVGGRPRKLLEAVAADVAELVLADERVRQVRVRVTKPQAPLPVEATVAVEITRDREGSGEPNDGPAGEAPVPSRPTGSRQPSDGPAGEASVPSRPTGSGQPEGGAPVDPERSGEPKGGAPVDREGRA